MILEAALIQLCSGRDPERNIAMVGDLVRAAVAGGARLVLTPEMTNIIEPDRARLRGLVGHESTDRSVTALAHLAQDAGVWLLAGSLALQGEEDRLVNRSLLFSPRGLIVARYDKIHLFDVDLPSGERFRESDAYASGSVATLAPLPSGVLGMTICYDLRFPQIFGALARAGAQIIAVPSAFTVPTGEAHWHVLLRARAIETGAYVLAPAQSGLHESGRRSYGHSLAVSPWGEVLRDAGEGIGWFPVRIDLAQVEEARRRIPAWRTASALKGPQAVASYGSP